MTTQSVDALKSGLDKWFGGKEKLKFINVKFSFVDKELHFWLLKMAYGVSLYRAVKRFTVRDLLVLCNYATTSSMIINHEKVLVNT